MKEIAWLGLLLTALCTPAAANEMKEGWGFQFRQDTFDKTIVPLAMMSESGDSFDKSLIAFACGPDGKLMAFFQPERFMPFAEAAKAKFRDGDATRDFTFAIGEVPHFGKRLVVSLKDSAAIAAIFEAANGADVPFKTEKKQGVFTSIGSKQTFSIMRSLCGL
jgi:hypothetical protein